MIARLFHRNENAKRRGDFPPGRSRFILRRGVTLVELMIAMLILTIVCLSWFEILSIQSAKREALRREGVERLAGMMEAFLASFRFPDGTFYLTDNTIGDFQGGDSIEYNPDALTNGKGYMFRRIPKGDSQANVIRPIFSDYEIQNGLRGAAVPGYRLHVGLLDNNSSSVMNLAKVQDGQMDCLMRNEPKILVGDLYEREGRIDIPDCPRRICRFMLFMRNSW